MGNSYKKVLGVAAVGAMSVHAHPNLTGYHPIIPIGEGITNMAYAVPAEHPMYAPLSAKLNIQGPVALKFMHNPSSLTNHGSDEHIQVWLEQTHAVPKHQPLSEDEQAVFYPSIPEVEWQDTYTSLNNKEGKWTSSVSSGEYRPNFTHPSVQGNPAMVMEMVTPIQDMRKTFEAMVPADGVYGIPADFVWPMLFMRLIKRHFDTLQTDLIKNTGKYIRDNHAGNWGLRLRQGWEQQVRQLFDNSRSRELGNPSFDKVKDYYQTLSNTQRQHIETLQRKVHSIMFEPTDDPYGPLVVIDSDHVSDDMENNGIFQGMLNVVQRKLFQRPQDVDPVEIAFRAFHKSTLDVEQGYAPWKKETPT